MAVAKANQGLEGQVAPGKQYPIDEALKLVKEFATAKFDEAVDAAVNLGIDASKSDQQVRGSTVMPHGTGKTRARGGVHLRQERGAGQGGRRRHRRPRGPGRAR